MPDGCRIGSGAEASVVPLPLMSICSTEDTSIGWSTYIPGDSSDGLWFSLGPRNQESPPANFTGLVVVLGLPGNFRGERTFGSKENFSLTFSSTDGATYVKPRKTWLALSLSVESSGLSTGVWLVNLESNWLTSSADCRNGLKGGSTLRASRSSQFICRKKAWAWTSAASPAPPPSRNEAFRFSSFFRRSLASCVRYGGRLSLHFKILSIVFFRFSPVNGGYLRQWDHKCQHT